MKYFNRIITIFTVIFIATSSSLASAHDQANVLIKERMEAMKSIQNAVKELVNLARAKDDFDSALVRNTARSLMVHTRQIPDKFRVKDTTKPSEAAEAIWQNYPDFIMLSEHLLKAVEQATDSETATDLQTALKHIGAACKACHTKYRIR